MSKGRMLAIALLAVGALPSMAAAEVDVTFVAPETFTDRDFREPRVRALVMETFETFFAELGERHLEEGQTVAIEVLDIDLAGTHLPFEPALNDLRILRGVTPPRFKLRYSFTANGETRLTGEEVVTDIDYQSNPMAATSREPFAHEKAMLRRWFKARFVDGQPATS